MKKTILRYGIYGALCIVILFILALTLGSGLSYSAQEVIGYATMIASLSFVFLGVRHFRERVNNGKVKFGQALVIGLAITLITAVAFGILDVIYVKYINPDFTEEYYTRTLENLQASLPAAEYEVQKAKMEAQKELFMSPGMNFLIMTATVFMIGLIVSLLSALILQRK